MVSTNNQLTDQYTTKCLKCKTRILDQYYLQTKDGLYHLKCLKCQYCNLELENQVNCYNVNGDIYCRIDYERLFNPSINNICNKCGIKIEIGQFIQRTKSNNLFHLDCFKCSICDLILQTGQQFIQIEENSNLICEKHFTKSTYTNNNLTKSKDKQTNGKELIDRKLQNKNKRNRTSFKLNQMAEMKTFFEANKNPDSTQLNQLAIYTGLQPRVLRRRSFLQQKSIGPLIVNDTIDYLKTSDIDLLDDEQTDCKLNQNNSSDELYCFKITKHNQYNWLFENLANQFLVLV